MTAFDPPEFDVAVVGLGGLGSAAAYWAARDGRRVVGFEQFELGHVRGASHDRSRIIRRSYHTPGYVALAAEAYDAWAVVEADGGAQIVTTTGGLDLFPPGAAIDPGPYRSSLEACGVPYEWLDAAEIRRRWPAFARGALVTDDVAGLYSDVSGVVPAGPATAELQRLAAAHGAELRAHSPVAAVRPHGGEVDVVLADGTTVRVGSVVIAADAWTNRLLEPLGAAIPLVTTREQVSYYPPHAGESIDDLAVGRFPLWIWMDDPSFYGFPEYGLAGHAKVSEDCGGAEVDPDTRTFDPDPTMEQRAGEFLAALVGDRFAAPQTTTCLYTLTSDRDFVLDHLPEHPNVVVGLGAAHAFKFAAWFGKELAALAGGAGRREELAPFRFDRPSLHAPTDRASWMV
ncbi:MAG TPA: FAD-dependent oxidoreductase [Ilumatobacter sp.]|nr:FAD-dependent oxidoreductase [Ilumatobacter sp.]